MSENFCQHCNRSTRPLWVFREDDRHCALCSRKIMHLQVGHRVPGGGEIFLYDQGKKGIEVYLTSVTGVDFDASTRRRRPALDLSRCAASFNGPGCPRMDFRILDVTPSAKAQPYAVLLRLEPTGPIPTLPKSGVAGSLKLATLAGNEQFKARLIPRQELPVAVACEDPSCRVLDPTTHALRPESWQIHQAGRDQTLELVMTAKVPIWIRKAEAKVDDAPVEIKGFEAATRLNAGGSHRFSLNLDTSSWKPNQPRPLELSFSLANLRTPEVISGDLRISGGRPLEIKGENPRILTLALGRTQTVRFSMQAATAVGDEARDWPPSVRIDSIGVTRDPDVGDWLRVIKPSKEQLPLDVPPHVDSTSAKELELLVDTSRLDRERFSQALLTGRVHVTDTTLRRYEREIRVTTHRLNPLDADLAIDWGTTNTCAAYRDPEGTEPIDVPFSTDQERAGQFPSELYFLDASNHDAPVFEIGPVADDLGRAKPECCLRSLKRKFQAGGKVQVVDERGRIESYTAERLVQHVIHRLVGLAEESLGREIRRLGLTFPTKWRWETRDRLATVASALQIQLAAERRPIQVTVHPPQIDEANAVAIALLTSGELPEGLPGTYHIVAYDFGGGTIDTSVLEVSYDEIADALRTRYVGLGGLKDFGGDEVTRATMMILHERITDAVQNVELALEGRPKNQRTWVKEIPLSDDVGEGHRAGVELYLLGRKNWAKLWEIAEKVKFDLCNEGRSTGDAVWSNLNRHLGEIESVVASCPLVYDEKRKMEVDGPVRLEYMRLDAVVGAPGLKSSPIRERISFTLDDVYDFELDDIERCNNGRKSTIRERVNATIEEISWQCNDAAPVAEPAIIVLAGGGCRLPLVRELLQERFPSATILHDPRNAKQRVARGMASYLAIESMSGTRLESTRSVDVIHHHIGVKTFHVRPGQRPTEVFTPIARAGSPIDDATRHEFRFRPRSPGPDGVPQLELFLQSANLSTRLGPVAFDRPIGGDGCVAEPLPYVTTADYVGSMAILGNRGIEIVVALQGRSFGPYPIGLPTETLLALLQQ